MEFYECIYDCGEGNYCVDCGTSLGNFKSPPTFMIICKKHQLGKGAKFEYDMSDFMEKFSSDGVSKNIYNVEVIDFSGPYVRFRTDLDCSNFNIRDIITYSCFNDAQSWEKDGNNYIVTLRFSRNNIVLKKCEDKYVYPNWTTLKVMRYSQEQIEQKGKRDEENSTENLKKFEIIERMRYESELRIIELKYRQGLEQDKFDEILYNERKNMKMILRK